MLPSSVGSPGGPKGGKSSPTSIVTPTGYNRFLRMTSSIRLIATLVGACEVGDLVGCAEEGAHVGDIVVGFQVVGLDVEGDLVVGAPVLGVTVGIMVLGLEVSGLPVVGLVLGDIVGDVVVGESVVGEMVVGDMEGD
mmetsp:Transcript_18587/g.25878  ORF Transcript_18587/g.25878 Transcript_18587/m.25878 type:complete len:137 (-) Transcript_18587:116-526(-)